MAQNSGSGEKVLSVTERLIVLSSPSGAGELAGVYPGIASLRLGLYAVARFGSWCALFG